MDIFFEIHKGLPREGPGDSQSTRQAFALMKGLPANPRTLDIGCGPGRQTLDLAAITGGNIIAVDTHQPFLDHLQSLVEAQMLSERIKPMNASMFELKFPEQSFDILWSEGAIYIIGFEKGLKTWRPLLKPGGYLAVTEISWLKPDPPDDVYRFWMSEYPGMHGIEDNLRILQASGYRKTNHFSLPASSWWIDYYNPIEARLPELREKFHGNAEALGCIDATQKEIDMYRKYSDWYGYVFYVAQTG